MATFGDVLAGIKNLGWALAFLDRSIDQLGVLFFIVARFRLGSILFVRFTALGTETDDTYWTDHTLVEKDGLFSH